jgi:hypothetical protein
MDGGTDTLDGSEDWGAVLNTQIFADNPSSHNAPRGSALYRCPYQGPRACCDSKVGEWTRMH